MFGHHHPISMFPHQHFFLLKLYGFEEGLTSYLKTPYSDFVLESAKGRLSNCRSAAARFDKVFVGVVELRQHAIGKADLSRSEALRLT